MHVSHVLVMVFKVKSLEFSKINVKKNTDMNMAKIACFLSLLLELRSHNT